jgi:hypothetical protein
MFCHAEPDAGLRKLLPAASAAIVTLGRILKASEGKR